MVRAKKFLSLPKLNLQRLKLHTKVCIHYICLRFLLIKTTHFFHSRSLRTLSILFFGSFRFTSLHDKRTKYSCFIQ